MTRRELIRVQIVPRTTPPSTRKAAPLVALAAAEHV